MKKKNAQARGRTPKVTRGDNPTAARSPKRRAATVSPNCRVFHLGDVISAIYGVLVAPGGVGAVYDVLNFMTGDSLFTHQLPRAGREVKPFVLAQHPELADIDISPVNRETWRTWMAEQVARYGEIVVLRPMAAGEYTPTDPLLELASMTDKPIIVIKQD